MENLKTVHLWEIGGVNTSHLQRVIAGGEVFVLTYQRVPVAYLAQYPVTDEVLVKCESAKEVADRVRALKTTTRDKLWSGETLGVLSGRSSIPVASLIPVVR